jgi:hypothetical protein
MIHTCLSYDKDGLTGCHAPDQRLARVLLPHADSSKGYMLLGCFPDPEWGNIGRLLNEDRLQDTGMSADRCAAMARAAEPPYTSFTISNSEW